MTAPLLPILVAVPFVAALLALPLGRLLGRWTGGLMVIAALVSFGAALRLLLLAAAPPVLFDLPWIPALEIDFRLRADNFGLFFAMVVSGVGALVATYSVAYISELPGGRVGRYYAALSAFMGAMLGIALADDLILLFVFWEVTSVTSFLLIGFWYEEPNARAGALTALQVTALGGLAMMVGFILVGIVTGTFAISDLAQDAALRTHLAASPALLPAFLLIFAGIVTKSAQVPFHFWLPTAMVAPTPVSTYLHAAAMVKAGVFLAGRMLPLFGDTPYWPPLLTSFGLVTFALGAYQAFRETDLKAMLARTTFSALGLMIMLYGLKAADQDGLQILSHAVYKGALFLVVGIVEHATHSRDLRELGGLRRQLPITFLVAAGAALSMSGLPPFLGFLAKEALYTELLDNHLLGALPLLRFGVIGVAIAANALLIGVALKITGVFLGDGRHEAQAPPAAHHDPPGLWLPPAVLAGVALLVGLLSLSPAAGRVASLLSSDLHAHLHLSLWPTQAAPLALSVITVLLGVVIYRERATIERWQGRLAGLRSMQQVWDGGIAQLTAYAEAYSARWQNGSLRWYFSATLLFTAAVGAVALERGGLSLGSAPIDLQHLTWQGAALCGLTMAATVLVVRATTRLAAAIALTAVGFLVALTYVVYRSPDILLTQILIETVSTIFILLVLYFMPAFRKHELSAGATATNLAVSCAVGALMFLLTLLCTSPVFRETNNLARDYLTRSLPDAGGQNSVNVIIVDFRAMDTTGEITVLVVVGLCVFGVLRARRSA
jgi:NADH:ubiquinone oxidoreductase subunit 5 (subunit L)/multisubunit Na+/H+ antiporter MnhA subunit